MQTASRLSRIPLLVALFLAFAAPAAFAQTTVQGSVMDVDGEPLIGATVLIQGTTQGDVVGVDGTYQIRTEQAGEVVLAASFVGFATERRIVALTGGAMTEDFTLREDALGLGEVFVTGVVNPVSKLQSSVSITTLEPEAVEAVVPRNTAEIFRSIPGIRSEASAGDGNTNITVRGVPISAGGSKYLQLQEDGLPILLFGDIAFATADIFLRADPTVGRVEAIRGGSASTLSSNSPAGLINFISQTGQVEGGTISTTAGLDFDFQRVDFAYGAPVGDGLSFHVGGFFRSGEGERDTGYLAQQGGQIKANVTKFFEGGYARIYGKYLNDRTPAYMPMPIRVTGSNDDPSFEDAGGLSVNREVPHSARFLTNYGFGAEGQRRRVSIADGLHPVSTALGAEFSFDLGNGFTAESRARFALNSGRFVAPFTATTGTTADVMGALEGATGRDLTGATLSRAESGEAWNGDLLQGIVLFDTELKNFNNLFADTKLTKSFAEEAGFPASITAGFFSGSQRINMAWLWNSYLMEVEGDNASLIDVTAADGTELSEDGLVGYGAAFFGNCCAVEFDAAYNVKAPYAAISVTPVPQLSIDASVRYDYGKVTGVGSGGTVAAIDVNLDGEISAVEENVNVIDHAQKNPVDYTYDYWSFSGGANYTLAENTAVFGRVSQGYSAKADRVIFPSDSYLSVESLGGGPKDRLQQAEVGVKQRFDAGGLFVTGFYASTREQGGFEATTQEFIDQDYRALGVEVEGVVRMQGANVRGAVTYTNAEVTSGDNEGNRPRRQPALLFSLVPSYSMMGHTAGFSVVGQSSAYAQDSNELELPGFALVNAFAEFGLTPTLGLGIAANNVFDSIGITESEEGAIPDNGYIRARSVSGRSISASLRYRF